MRAEDEASASGLVHPRRSTRRYAVDSTPADRTPRAVPVAALRNYASALRVAARRRPSVRRNVA